MKALTVRQPWAWAIMHGGKDVENRTRNIAGLYRGPVAIHVALSFADIDAHWNRAIAAEVGRLSRAGLPGNESVVSHIGMEDRPGYHVHRRYGHRGAVIGVVNLVDVHNSRSSITADHLGEPVCWDNHTPIGSLCSPWAMTGHHHLVLANPRPFAEPIPARGKLGLWKPDDDLAAACRVAAGLTVASEGGA